MLSDKSGRTKRFSEDFLREFFILISESLEQGETVKVKGLGTFRLSKVEPRKSIDVTTGEPMEISGHTKVVFIPSKEIAEAINAPFEAFSALEIADGIDLSVLEDNISETNQTPLETENDVDNAVESSDIKVPEEQEDHIDPGFDDDSIVSENPDISVITSQLLEDTHDDRHEEDTASLEETQDYDSKEENDNHNNWLKGFLSGIGVAIALIAITMGCWLWYMHTDSATTAKTIAKIENTASTSIDSSDTSYTNPTAAIDNDTTIQDLQTTINTEEVPTAPSDEVVYDTIGKTRYLTTMAKAHYGNYNLWPYIYEENKAFLRHPDRIRPGTPVVVPKLSKYGVDPKNPKDLEAAKRLGIEIYARYKKE